MTKNNLSEHKERLAHSERQRRLRADWRPTVMRCDGILIDVTADDYAAHSERLGGVQML